MLLCSLIARAYNLHRMRFIQIDMYISSFVFCSFCILADAQGRPIDVPPLIHDIAKHPVLSKVKLIAEPWDLGMYQVCVWNWADNTCNAEMKTFKLIAEPWGFSMHVRLWTTCTRASPGKLKQGVLLICLFQANRQELSCVPLSQFRRMGAVLFT